MAEYSIIDCLHLFFSINHLWQNTVSLTVCILFFLAYTASQVVCIFMSVLTGLHKLWALFCGEWITENYVPWIIIFYSVLNGLLKNSVFCEHTGLQSYSVFY